MFIETIEILVVKFGSISDTECMKIDLAEEQMREKTIIQQKQHAQKSKLIEVLPEKTAIEKMNDTEKKEFADKYANSFKIIDKQLAYLLLLVFAMIAKQ